jgi:hypothetical protein
MNTYQPDTKEAHEFFNKLQERVKALEAEINRKDNELIRKDEKIDALMIELKQQREEIRELLGHSKEMKVDLKVQCEVSKVQAGLLVEQSTKLDQQSTKLDEQLDVINILEDEILNVSNEVSTITEEIVKVKSHLGIAVEDRVMTDKLKTGDLERVVIYDTSDNGLFYYVRCQTKYIKTQFLKLKRRYPNVKQIYEVNYNPNSVLFWKSLMVQYKHLIKKHSGNLFKLECDVATLLQIIGDESDRRRLV